jgi:putrescine aminotransferase
MTEISNMTGVWRELDAAHHIHPFMDTGALNREGARVITHAEGVYIYTSTGDKVIDGMSGLWNMQVGHGRPEIIDAIASQLRKLDYYNTFFKTTHPGVAELSREIAALCPSKLNKVFYTSSGSEANDTLIRIVRYFWKLRGKPEKSQFISRRLGYHGSTIGGASLSGMPWMHEQAGLPIPGMNYVTPPYWWVEGRDMTADAFGLWAANQVAEAIDRIGAENVAAVIGEPIQGAGGVVIPPDNYWPTVAQICRERDVLYISDEVICGFGRTGEWWGCDYYGVEPDVIVFAKGVTSGYFPMGGVVLSDEIAEVISHQGGEFYHGFTYSGHPGACAAALANLNILRGEKLPERVKTDIGPYLQAKWRALGEHPLVGEARMVGLIGALELSPDKAARAAFPEGGVVGLIARDISFREGLVMRAVRDALILAPPLVITESEVDAAIAIVARVLDETHAECRRRGLM